jgi:hypothetical protein
VIANLRSRRGTIAATVVAACVALAVASRLGTWTDEEYTLVTTGHGVAYALDRALTYELQAPLYFVIEAAWRDLNGSLVWARIPSLACGFALFAVFLRLGRRIAPHANPVAFATIATLNPFVVFAAFEIRLYALALLLGGVTFLAFDAGFVSGSSRRARVAFACAAVAGIYVQYFLAFALIGFGATLSIRRPRAVVSYAIACVPIVVAALPLAAWAHHQVGGYAAPQPPVSFVLRHALFHPWLDFVFPYDRDWDVSRTVHVTYDGVVALAIVALVAARLRLDRAALGWIACAATIEITYLTLLAGLGLQLEDRHYVALFVPLACAAYAVVSSPRDPRRRGEVAGVVTLACALTAAVLVTRYRHLAQPGDWRRVATYLESSAKPGDAIVVFAADAIPALRRQYDGPLPIVPFPRPIDPNRYEADAFVVHSVAEAVAALVPLRRYARVWFVSDVRCRSDENSYGCSNVAPAIARTFRIEGSRSFYESRVDELSAIGGRARSEKTSKP